MLSYSYKARDNQTGQVVESEIDAKNENAAGKLLIEKGLVPLEIKAKDEVSGLAALRSRITTKQKVIFARQLSTLVNAGLPLVQSLSAVAGQTENANFKVVINKIINDIEAGSTLADAMARYPKLFDSVYVSLIAAGETSGTLDTALERIANRQEADAEIVSKVRGALMYPLIVLGVLFLVLIFMMTTVLPQVRNIYKDLPGANLPFLTSWLLDLSHFITKWWWVSLLLLGSAVFLVVRWLRTPGGIDFADNFKLNAPLISPLFRKLYMARFTRTASTLVASGVPLIKMLETSAQAIGNTHVAASVTAAAEKVKGGTTLSASLKDDPNFLDLVPNMISIGEQSGALDDMLSKVADYYEKEVDNQIKSISTVIEPVLMISVGIIALIIVAAVLLPIYGLVGKNLSAL